MPVFCLYQLIKIRGWVIKEIVILPGMVLAWIGIVLGVLIIIVLIWKLSKTPPHKALTVEYHCKICGERTNGLKCPRCAKNNHYGR